MQKFYSAQAAKDKENMKQAVNYKVQWTCKNQKVVFIVVNIFCVVQTVWVAIVILTFSLRLFLIVSSTTPKNCQNNK